MSGNLIIILFASLAYSLLGVTVVANNPRNQVNRHFGLFSLAVTTWTLSNGLVSAYAAAPLGYVWGRIAFASASLIALSFFLFARVFPSTNPPTPRFLTTLFVLTGVATFFVSFTPLIVNETTKIRDALKVVYGPLHPFFAVYFLACFGFSLLLLLRKLRVLKGIENLRVRYLFLGVLTAGLGAIITNLVLPLAFGTSRFSQYGPLFGILMIAMIAHAIIRHRLMNIRLVIRRGVVYLLAVVISGGVFLGLLSLFTTFLFPRPRDLPLAIEVVLVLVIVLLFQPLKRALRHCLDRYLYREPYDYQGTIREASRSLATILHLNSLLDYACEIIGRTIRPEAVFIYIGNPARATYTRMATRSFIEDNDTRQPNLTLSEQMPLPYLLARTCKPLLLDEVRQDIRDEDIKKAISQLIDMGGEITFPILHENKLIGFLILTHKLSGDPYFAEDIDLLSTLVGQAAIAIKNAQLYKEVALANEYVTNIVATMESGVIAIGTDGNVTLFNLAAERIIGLAAQVIRSESIDRLPVNLAQSLQSTLADGQPRAHPETTILDQAGRLISVSCSTSPLRDRSGTILGAVAVFTDLSRLKELEAERRRAERLASFGALASGIAHEIKNPLVAIKTFAELLPERFTEPDFRQDFSEVVIREITRIDDLVARLHGLAASGNRPLIPQDIRESIEDTLTLLRGQLEQKRIAVKRLYERSLPLISGDTPQLTQLFLNLFLNSLEAMNPGGQLTIRLTRRQDFGALSLVVEVSDMGSGIPEQLLGRVFHPFVTTKSRGSGLGLAICRGIADAHNATIRAHNNADGLGTTVAIEFPALQEMSVVLRT